MHISCMCVHTQEKLASLSKQLVANSDSFNVHITMCMKIRIMLAGPAHPPSEKPTFLLVSGVILKQTELLAVVNVEMNHIKCSLNSTDKRFTLNGIYVFIKWLKMKVVDATREAVSIVGYSDRTIRGLRKQFFDNKGWLDERRQGKYERIS